jgi:zinc D-Ala-D-Ala carboxypeptidase
MRISKHISIEEATLSPTGLRLGIDNTPNEDVLVNMKLVAERCFEPIRNWYGRPIKVNSFYRCEALNRAVGSKSATSQHVQGKAIDISTGTKAGNKLIYEWAKNNLIFDQLINEYDYSWVHISYNKNNNRNQTLIIT